MVLSVKSVCPEFDRSMNMRRIINGSHGGYEFSRLARDEEEADVELKNISCLHTASDDWDEFLGETKSVSSSRVPSVSNVAISSEAFGECKEAATEK